MKKYLLIGFLIGFGLAILIAPFVIVPAVNKTNTTNAESAAEMFPLLAKRIMVGNPNDIIVNFTQLRLDLQKYVQGLDVKTGVYFEYLPTGVHIGVNDREEFYRASLVKLPLVMRAYKFIQEGKIKQDELVTIRRDFLEEGYGDLWKTGAGTEIPVSKLIDLILTESDNTAYLALLYRVNQALGSESSIDEKGINEVYDYLDIPREETGRTYLITPRNYSSILKALYFSAYLNYTESEEVLSTLTRSKFTDWMPSGVSTETKVAHKMGIFQADNSKNNVHSDCGIVYVPNRQYILCVMMKTEDTDLFKKHLGVISKMVFDYVTTIKKEN